MIINLTIRGRHLRLVKGLSSSPSSSFRRISSLMASSALITLFFRLRLLMNDTAEIELVSYRRFSASSA